MGRLEDAARCFRAALDRGGDAEVHAYLLASVRGDAVPPAAPRSYVQQLFDSYASEFESHLVGVLQYHGHELLVATLKTLAAGHRFARALDLGCGTGLCGKLIADICDAIDGVDLSHGMLNRAAGLDLYRRLVQADIVDFLRDVDTWYDLVIAGDVFTYVGDLAPVFEGVRRVMAPGGVFCFSIERADDVHLYELRASSRFAQSERFVRRLAAEHGFDVVALESGHLRNEKGQSIEGSFAYLKAPSF